MKKYFLPSMITAFLLILSNGIQAQYATAKLNQVDLIKQFVNKWKGEIGKDTTAFWDIKSNGDGLECKFKYVTKDKMFMEGTQEWVYDKKTDKFILSTATNGMDNGTSGLWFTSKNKCLIISDINNPEKATFKIETEFKSPDTFTQKSLSTTRSRGQERRVPTLVIALVNPSTSSGVSILAEETRKAAISIRE